MRKLLWAVLALSVVLSAQAPVKKQTAKKPRKAPATKPAKPAPVKQVDRRAEAEGDPKDRSDWFYSQRAYPLGYIPAGIQVEGVREMDRLERQRDAVIRALGLNRSLPANATTWTNIGSAPARSNGEVFPNSAGRVGAIAIDPRDPNVVYAGTSTGGVWKTTNGGTSWTALGDGQVTLSIGSLLLDPRNPNTVYAGTGEKANGAGRYDGAGILKTTDGGATWRNIPASFVGPFGSSVGGARIASLAMHPSNSQILLAGVGRSGNVQGIWRSTDAGETWNRVYTAGNGNTVEFDPSTGNVAYASIEEIGVVKSTDGGVTWAASSQGLPSDNSVGRVEIAVAPSQPNTLYAGIAKNSDPGSGSLLGFYKSTDGAATWTRLGNTPDYCSNQCWFDHFVAVHPTNPNLVVGGQDRSEAFPQKKVFRTTDGGNSWKEISLGPNGVGLHPDVHIAAFTGDGSKLYVGNDGGIVSTSNPSADSPNWADLNEGMATTLYYPYPSIHPTDINIAFAGAQDNGTQRYSGTTAWQEVTCGDGGSTAINVQNPSIVYAACQQVDISRSTQGGTRGTFQRVLNGFPTGADGSVNERSQFIAPMVIDPSAGANLYFGSFRVWQTVNGGDNWRAISNDLGGDGSANISSLAVAPSDSKTVYAGTTNGKLFVSNNVDAGAGATWTDHSTGLVDRQVVSVTVSPTAPGTVYLTLSGYRGFSDQGGHVYKSTNSGSSWANITNNLPNVPCNDLQIDPDLANTLYLATDVGVFISSNDGGSWSPLASGFPRVPVTGLRLHKASRTLRASTYGRGMYDLSVPSTVSGPAPVLSSGGVVNNGSFKSPNVPGSISAVFGQNLGSALTLATAVPLPTSIDGLALNFGSTASPMFFTSPGQAVIQIPWELAGQTSAQLTASRNGQTSTGVAVALAAAAPALLSTNQQGTGQGVILIATTGEIAAPSGSIPGRAARPVKKGEFLTIYCIGLGDVDNRPAAGAASPAAGPLARTHAIPTGPIGWHRRRGLRHHD